MNKKKIHIVKYLKMFTVSVRLQETFPSEKSKYVKNMSKRVVHVLFVWWHILYIEYERTRTAVRN